MTDEGKTPEPERSESKDCPVCGGTHYGSLRCPSLLGPGHPAIDASAPDDSRCADCSIDQEACPACYAAWWATRHPNVTFVEPERSEVGGGELIEWTPEMEAERIRLCEFFVREGDRFNEDPEGLHWPEMAQNCLRVEEALTILGEIARVSRSLLSDHQRPPLRSVTEAEVELGARAYCLNRNMCPACVEGGGCLSKQPDLRSMRAAIDAMIGALS